MSQHRVVLVGPAPPYRGGIADFNAALHRALVDAGCEVHSVSFTVQYPAVLFPGKSQLAPEAEALPNSVRLIHSLWPPSWSAAAKHIADWKPTLVIFRYWIPFMAPVLGTIARKLRKQLPHAILLALTDNVVPHERRPFDNALTRYFVRPFHGFMAMSKQVLEDLDTFTSTQCRSYQPHPVYDAFGEAIPKVEARSHLSLDPHGRYLLFFGLVRPYKGLGLLLEAMARPEVAALSPPVRLIVAGEFYEPREKYDRIIEQLGLKDRLIIHDRFIPQEEVKQYFSAADMVAQTYTSATQSGVTQIAFQMGKPMLVTNVGGLAELIGHNREGYVIDGKPHVVAAAIADFYTFEREPEMARHVLEGRARFQWKAMVEAIFALCLRIEKNEC